MENFKLESSAKFYCIDFEKVKSLEDVILVLKGLNVQFMVNEETIPSNLKEIFEKGFIKEVAQEKF